MTKRSGSKNHLYKVFLQSFQDDFTSAPAVFSSCIRISFRHILTEIWCKPVAMVTRYDVMSDSRSSLFRIKMVAAKLGWTTLLNGFACFCLSKGDF